MTSSRSTQLKVRSTVLLAAWLVLAPSAEAQRALPKGSPQIGNLPAPIPAVAPEAVGISSIRLARITGAFKKEVDEKRLPGAVIMIVRKGRLAYAQSFGVRDPKTSEPMRTDTLFRIYSMTKPITSVAAVMLMEDGVLQLSDPVSKWLPAFKDMKVATAAGDVAPDRAMTVQDLLRHTAGLPYGELTANAAVKDSLTKAGFFKPNLIEFDSRDMSADEFVARMAKVSLIHQPGTTWEYSFATDVLGRVIEAASKKRLSDFMAERIFKPLKMNDTGFFLPAAKLPRLAEPLEKEPVGGAAIKLIDVTKQPGNDSGGAGLVSSAGDYIRFAQMLANGGVLDGQRILSRTSVKLMTSDHLGKIQTAPTPGGMVLGARPYTFGLGFAVRPADGLAQVAGSAGDFDWGGYAGTGFWVDPKEQLVAVMMVQSGGPIRATHRNLFRQLVYQSIAD